MANFAFFGTPDFAVPALNALHRFCEKYGHTISMVVCQPDSPKGRGQKLLPCEIKKEALSLALPVFSPKNVKISDDIGKEFWQFFAGQNIDLAIVVAYGHIIPKKALTIPVLGFINIHASLLPKFRGAAPAQRAIDEGYTFSGVTLMDLKYELDAGDIYKSKEAFILPFDTSLSFLHRLSFLGAELLYETLPLLLDKKIAKTPQDENQKTFAKKIEKEESRLNFLSNGKKICHHVRALFNNPGSYVVIDNKRLKVSEPFFIKYPKSYAQKYSPGIIVCKEKFLGISCNDGIVYFGSVQKEGGRMQKVKEALSGSWPSLMSKVD